MQASHLCLDETDGRPHAWVVLAWVQSARPVLHIDSSMGAWSVLCQCSDLRLLSANEVVCMSAHLRQRRAVPVPGTPVATTARSSVLLGTPVRASKGKALEAAFSAGRDHLHVGGCLAAQDLKCAQHTGIDG